MGQNENIERTNSHGEAERPIENGMAKNENIVRTGEGESSLTGGDAKVSVCTTDGGSAKGKRHVERGVVKGVCDKKDRGGAQGKRRVGAGCVNGKRRVEDDGVNGTRGMDVVREILGTCEGTVVSLEAQIALYVGSEFIAKARQEKVCTTKRWRVKS
jgi:hypothetical protein